MGRVPDRHAAEVAMTDPMVPQPHVGQHRGTYGIDAPYVPLLLGIGGLTMLGVTALNVLRHAGPLPVVWCALVSLVMLGSTASYLYTTRAGKFAFVPKHEPPPKMTIQTPTATLLLKAALETKPAQP